MNSNIAALAELVGQRLVVLGAQLTTAESCTGGGISAALTTVPGSSKWFEFGFVVYANRAKCQLLGLDAGVIESCGAVSKEVVEAMAVGARDRAGADYAVAVSGIAGPDGGTADKPVGTVWLAWATPQSVEAELFHFSGSRQAVREQAIKKSLSGLLQRLGE